MMNKKKKSIAILIAIFVILSVCLLTLLCTNKVQYGDWLISEVGNPDTNTFSDFPYPITVTIKKNGEIYLEGDLFGVAEQKGQTYAFTQTVKVGDIEEMIYQEGVWEIKNEDDGTIGLYIYPYDEKLVYKLIKLS